jgi:hypothetical protein
MNMIKPLLFPLSLALAAQAPTPARPHKRALKASPAKATTAPKPEPPKNSVEAQAARQGFKTCLDVVNNAWFGKAYQGINALDLQGSLGITLSAATLNAKTSEATQGQVKTGFAKEGRVNLELRGTYFATGDFKTEMKGDFGNLIYYRLGRRGFLYSKEQNAYTTRVDPPPTDAPLSFMAWFRQVLNDIQTAYVDSGGFQASLGKTEGTKKTFVFNAPTGPYDPKKREQGLSESLGFWKRGRMELTIDTATNLPQFMEYSNEQQGIRTGMSFAYGVGNKLQTVNITNQSRGMEGPGNLQIAYSGDGLMNQVSGQLSSEKAKVNFNMSLTWAKGRKTSSIMTVPPPGATKKGLEEFETMLLVNLGGQLLDLQRNGLNLRSVKLTGK